MSFTAVLIGLGFCLAAGSGAVIRYGASELFNGDFPHGTIAVNLFASLCLGIATGVGLGDTTKLIMATAFLGSLSTWSTAANEVAIMARADEGRLAVSYLAFLVSSGILMAWFGLRFGQIL